jgi:pimeloyl-ACP methyl ester carboxylesterase
MINFRRSRFLALCSVIFSCVCAGSMTAEFRSELVDVAGRKVEVTRSGASGPTVVFEHGLGSDLTTWRAVQVELGSTVSWFSYSRAGFGASEKAPGVRGPTLLAEELHSALLQLHVPEPYLLVGHSSGALNVRVSAAKYPAKVIGVVLVDPSHERQSREILGSDAEALSKLSQIPPEAPEAIQSELLGLIPIFTSGVLEGSGEMADVRWL